VNFSTNSGSMKSLTTTKDHVASIDNVEQGVTYTIEVTAKNEETELASEPSTVTITIEEEVEETPAVEGLSGHYDENANTIDIQWNYNGPDAKFEVKINDRQSETVTQRSLKITDIQPGETYTITVTAIANDIRSEGRSVTIKTEAI